MTAPGRDGDRRAVARRAAVAALGAVAVAGAFPGRATATAVAQHAPWPDPLPTTAAVTPYGTYVIDGRLPDLFSGTPADGFTIRRAP
ncbi:hypothetical protein [Streptomyces sp. URMC 129]|uniref:hypothetical protein n=1 Tax=Streptomyces sp. URMC 129 TaxID=3423407 RepID=UPI003F1C2ECD